MFSINAMFYCSSLFALLSIVILMNMKETLENRKPFRFSMIKINRNEVIEVRVLVAAFITFLAYLSYGIILTVIPDWGVHLGVSNKGLFFMVFTFSSLLIRLISGRLSDKIGRVRIIKVSLVILMVSLGLIGFAKGLTSLMIGSAVYGLATGMLSPAITAWIIDLSHPDHRGKAVATMYIALEAGIGLGAFFAGTLYITDVSMIPPIFYSAGFATFLAFLYLQVIYKRI
jgi:MFS family permease